MLDSKVIIDRKDEVFTKQGGCSEMVAFSLPVQEEDVAEVYGYSRFGGCNLDFFNANNYVVKPYSGDSILTIDYGTSIFEVNLEHRILTIIQSRCPPVIDLYNHGYFTFRNRKVLLREMFAYIDNLILLPDCSCYEDIDKEFDYDWANYYDFAFTEGKAILLNRR